MKTLKQTKKFGSNFHWTLFIFGVLFSIPSFTLGSDVIPRPELINRTNQTLAPLGYSLFLDHPQIGSCPNLTGTWKSESCNNLHIQMKIKQQECYGIEIESHFIDFDQKIVQEKLIGSNEILRLEATDSNAGRIFFGFQTSESLVWIPTQQSSDLILLAASQLSFIETFLSTLEYKGDELVTKSLAFGQAGECTYRRESDERESTD